MLGLWGYRKNIEPSNPVGGILLALTLLRPQIGLIPLAFAAGQWWKAIGARKQVPRQAWSWLFSVALLFAPGFLFTPDWPVRWLSTPRPVFERALSGLIPRTLLCVVPYQTAAYWLILIAAGGLLLDVVALNENRLAPASETTCDVSRSDSRTPERPAR